MIYRSLDLLDNPNLGNVADLQNKRLGNLITPMISFAAALRMTFTIHEPRSGRFESHRQSASSCCRSMSFAEHNCNGRVLGLDHRPQDRWVLGGRCSGHICMRILHNR